MRVHVYATASNIRAKLDGLTQSDTWVICDLSGQSSGIVQVRKLEHVLIGDKGPRESETAVSRRGACRNVVRKFQHVASRPETPVFFASHNEIT